MALEAKVRLEVLRNLAHEPLEGQLPDEQLRRLLVLANLTACRISSPPNTHTHTPAHHTHIHIGSVDTQNVTSHHHHRQLPLFQIHTHTHISKTNFSSLLSPLPLRSCPSNAAMKRSFEKRKFETHTRDKKHKHTRRRVYVCVEKRIRTGVQPFPGGSGAASSRRPWLGRSCAQPVTYTYVSHTFVYNVSYPPSRRTVTKTHTRKHDVRTKKKNRRDEMMLTFAYIYHTSLFFFPPLPGIPTLSLSHYTFSIKIPSSFHTSNTYLGRELLPRCLTTR